MTRQVDKLAHTLLARIHSTQTLKLVSDTLEELTQNKSFKDHISAIVTDNTLTPAQKTTQLLHVIKRIELTILYDFFTDELKPEQLWLFDSSQIDYFDKFVQVFQRATEDISILTLTTAIELESHDLKMFADDLSETFNVKTIIHHRVNPSIIGGAQVKFENIMFDFSLRYKMQQFQREWLATLKKTDQTTGRHILEPSDDNESTEQPKN